MPNVSFCRKFLFTQKKKERKERKKSYRIFRFSLKKVKNLCICLLLEDSYQFLFLPENYYSYYYYYYYLMQLKCKTALNLIFYSHFFSQS